MESENILFSEYKLNNLIKLKNRIIMAPMTRAKASDDASPTDTMADYYARRADAGLIISEGALIQGDALGHYNIPGIYTPNHINKWKYITEKVHRNGGVIFLQLWHVGRVSHPAFLQGKLPISPSKTFMSGKIYRCNHLKYGESREATLQEIKELIDNNAIAAENAIKAGFDGVEIHGANGYLIDQFLHHHTNKRTDDYGGSPENMAKFALDIVRKCGEAIGYNKIGIRLSPGAYVNEIIGEEADANVFKYLLAQLNQYPIAYVHTGNINDKQRFPELSNMTMSEFIRKYYHGNFIACGSYTVETAAQGITNNNFDLVAMGRAFIANFDLIKRLKNKENLRNYDSMMLDTLY